jgi:hypothetical protein
MSGGRKHIPDWIKFFKAVRGHYELFNFLDVVSMALTANLISHEYRPIAHPMNTHGFLVLVSYFGALNLFSAFKGCRDSIDLIVQCFASIITFAFILGYFLFTFALFFLFTTEKQGTHESENVDDYLWTELKHILPFATGGFVLEGEMSNVHAIGQSLVVFIITILMLNLLVGILSEKLGDVVANKTISSYRLLL